ncbi:MAG: hypothetical protein QOK03_1256, partial [Candidatus Binataceae bacterium]|nr:hypothetical protein [Candidatus Binataceae bacterium]
TEGKASCVPVSLPHEDARDTVILKTAQVRTGHALF